VLSSRSNRHAKTSKVQKTRRTRATGLDRELSRYEAERARWLPEHEGEYVLIKGDDVLGFFETREEALAMGYARFGVVPRFVHQIPASKPIYRIPNALI
jgi:hypothetical protein